jgi:pyruvate formate lyase activating enzyme
VQHRASRSVFVPSANKSVQTLAYGRLAALESRTIEIKPFSHFHPGSAALTYSCSSYNLRCCWCQNWHLGRADPLQAGADYVSPEDLVAMALRSGDQGLCCSFTELTLLHKHNLATFPLVKATGLHTCYVSNGCMTVSTLRELRDAGLDAIKIEVKGDAQA